MTRAELEQLADLVAERVVELLGSRRGRPIKHARPSPSDERTLQAMGLTKRGSR